MLINLLFFFSFVKFKVMDIPILFCSLTFLAQGKTTNAHVFLFHVNLKIKGNGTQPTTQIVVTISSKIIE